MPATVRGLGFTYQDCLGTCAAEAASPEVTPELMQACVDLCKSNYPQQAAAAKQLIAGVSNQTLVIGAAAAVVLLLVMRR